MNEWMSECVCVIAEFFKVWKNGQIFRVYIVKRFFMKTCYCVGLYGYKAFSLTLSHLSLITTPWGAGQQRSRPPPGHMWDVHSACSWRVVELALNRILCDVGHDQHQPQSPPLVPFHPTLWSLLLGSSSDTPGSLYIPTCAPLVALPGMPFLACLQTLSH